MYAEEIRRIVTDVDARLVEAWMRLDRGTLDQLDRLTFKQEALIARDCVLAAPAESERLARSYGL